MKIEKKYDKMFNIVYFVSKEEFNKLKKVTQVER